MIAIQFRYSVLRYAWVRFMARRWALSATGPGSFLRLANVGEPKLPTPHWVRVRPLLSGICGSDLSAISAQSSVYLSAFTSFPFIPGHEVVGIVEEAGSAVTRVQPGQRVVVEPALGCRVRGIEQLCRPCLEGHDSNCERVTSGDIGPGIQTGFCRDTGGGWGGALVAHEGQLYPIPDALPNASAVMVEPLSCAIHGALSARVTAGSSILVVGCGTMGLLTVAALRAMGPPSTIVAMGKHSYQRELAASMGAGHLVPTGPQGYLQLAELTGGNIHPLPIGKPAVTGGFDVVFECVGASTALEDALRWVRPQGQVVMVGMPRVAKMDLTPSWYQEAHLTGAYTYSLECVGKRRVRTFELALELLAEDRLAQSIGSLVSHRFPLREHRKAIATAMRPGRHHAIKTVFDISDGVA